MSTASAPVEIGRVTLTVNDLDRVAGFYQAAIGLERLAGDAASVTLGAAGRPLIELVADRAAPRATRAEAGLFHTAFLLPRREDLGRWLHHAAATGIRIGGASDHDVSEALYLSDPEGNGIEIYADRPAAGWRRGPQGVRMTTGALDLDDLAASADSPWAAAPDGTVVGHVHLQVGALPEAEAFYGGSLGLGLTCRYPGGSFFASGGYHHHLATNVWNSRGAGRRRDPVAGLAMVELLADPDDHARISGRMREATGGDRIADPWGNLITLTAKGR